MMKSIVTKTVQQTAIDGKLGKGLRRDGFGKDPFRFPNGTNAF